MLTEGTRTLHALEELLAREVYVIDSRAPHFSAQLRRVEMLSRHLMEYTQLLLDERHPPRPPRRHPKIVHIRTA